MNECLDYTLAQVKGHVGAINRMKARDTLMQMTSLRLAAWGDAKALGEFQDKLLGKPVNDEADEALAAFGVRAG